MYIESYLSNNTAMRLEGSSDVLVIIGSNDSAFVIHSNSAGSMKYYNIAAGTNYTIVFGTFTTRITTESLALFNIIYGNNSCSIYDR